MLTVCNLVSSRRFAFIRCYLIYIEHWGEIDSILAMYTWWHHDMETFSAPMSTCEGNPSVTCGFSEELTTSWTISKMASEVDDFFTVGKNTVAEAVESLVIWDALTLMLDKSGPQRLIMRLDRDKYMNSPHFSLAFSAVFSKRNARSTNHQVILSVGE